MLAGVPDLHLPVPKGIYHSLYIEMKYDDGRISSEQKKFINRAAEYDNYCCVCYTAEEAIKTLREYIELEEGIRQEASNMHGLQGEEPLHRKIKELSLHTVQGEERDIP